MFTEVLARLHHTAHTREVVLCAHVHWKNEFALLSFSFLFIFHVSMTRSHLLCTRVLNVVYHAHFEHLVCVAQECVFL